MVTHDPGRRRPRRPPDHPPRRQDRPRRRARLGRRRDRADEADRLALGSPQEPLGAQGARPRDHLRGRDRRRLRRRLLRPHRHDLRRLRRNLQRVAEGDQRRRHRQEPGRTGKRRSPDDQRLAAAAGAEDAGGAGWPPARSSPRAASSTPKATRSAPNSPPSSSPRPCPTGSSRSPTSTATRRAARPKPRSTRRRPKRPDLELGEQIELIGQGSARTFRLVGFTQLGSASFGGASIAQVTLPVAQRLTHKVGRFDQISVAADDGRLGDDAEAADRSARCRAGVRVETGEGKRRPRLRRNPRQPRLPADLPARLRLHRGLRRLLPDLQHLLDHRRPAGHRVRDAAHARRLAAADPHHGRGRGAGDRPARRAARDRRRLPRSRCCSTRCFEAFGIDLPTTGLVLESRTIVVSLLVGVVVTLVSSLVPALRSTRVPPIAALHAFTPAAEPPAPAALRRRSRCCSALAGLAMVLIGLFGSAGAGDRGRPDRRRRGRRSSSPSRSSARAWCRRWRRSPAGRWSGCGG